VVGAAHESMSRVHCCVCIDRILGRTVLRYCEVLWAGSHALMVNLSLKQPLCKQQRLGSRLAPRKSGSDFLV